ncbi:MAG TPA: winged helix-turn-helix domain-containing tetratricopeptide repeat protein [Xanthobacteraceae bacterium]|nr:winged helix-turn-helix domain-containing tetratricopeptide repeat protein [Xanthobacteraceae bacterium]
MKFLFSDHTLDTELRELRRGSEPVAVEPQVFDLLVHLLAHRDRVVSKDDLIASVWGGRIVSDSTLTSRINAARKAVGDSGGEQKLIRTVARKGVRFVGVVHVEGDRAEPAHAAVRADELREPRPALPLPDRPAIAVLPFTNMTGDPGQEYFSDGISEDIITALSKLRWFFVIARNSSFIYKDKPVHMKQIAEELGVNYVVEGSVRVGGDRVRITAQLNDVSTGSHVWAERYDRELADVFAVQDEITEAIVAAIEPQLYAAENFRARREPPDSLDAWDLVMRAFSHYWRVTRQDNMAAQALLEKAVAIDPNYGRALGVLATSHTFGAHMGWEDMAAITPIVERAAQTAIVADGDDPWAHLALGSVYLFARRFDDSLAELEMALRLNPNFSLAQGYHGLVLAYCGRWEEASQAAGRALRLSPRDPFSAIYNGIASYAQFVGRNYEEAMRLAREGIRLRGDFVGAHRVLTAAAAMAGQGDVAKAALRELRRAQPNISLAWIALQMPIKQDAEREHYLEGFRRAGLE